MKLKYLLLFAPFALLANPVQTVNSAPVQVAYETRSQNSLSDQVYRAANPAVVTVFAGREIGSGSIVSSDGLVITNNHVVRESSQVSVKTANGQQISGRVISTDSRSDLALIQLFNSGALPAVPIANTNPQAGQPVFAIGSPYGRPGVMTVGSFSSARSNGDLQSRVVLEPGNSGGPLLNAQGEMIGVNKAILESSRGGNTGISIATSATIARQFIERNRPGSTIARVPSQSAQILVQPNTPSPRQSAPIYQPPNTALASRGNVVVVPKTETWGSLENSPGRSTFNPDYSSANQYGDSSSNTYAGNTYAGNTYAGSPDSGSAYGNKNLAPYPTPAQRSGLSGTRLGIMLDTRTMIVQQVETGSAAANGGLQMGDRLLGVNGTRLSNFDDLQAFMRQAPSTATFTISRGGRSELVQVRF